MISLADYRRRHAQYKTDPDLQALHAAAPWVVTWDDHESANDAWSRRRGEPHRRRRRGSGPPGGRLPSRPTPSGCRCATARAGTLYRRLRFGRLASLSMLDLRTYRDAAGRPRRSIRRLDDPDRTITGPEQLDFLLDGLADHAVQWKLVGNPVMIAPVRFPSALDAGAGRSAPTLVDAEAPPARGVPYNVDQWDGYPADGTRVLDAPARQRGITRHGLPHRRHPLRLGRDLPVDAATYPVNGAASASSSSARR